MGSSESKQVAARFSQTRYSSIQFPLRFDIYDTGRSRNRFALGDKKNPTHIVSLVSGLYGDLVLYNGPTAEADPVVLVRNSRSLGRIDDIEVAACADGRLAIREELRSRSNGWSRAFEFAVSAGPGLLPEKFEWRASRSDEVRKLGGANSGWKLLRLGRQEEIVAVVAQPRMSLSKVGIFNFVGSGATGELGDAWAAMAVTSFARMQQRQLQNTQSASSSAAASAGASAAACSC
ncbi:hypothetical protein CDD81_4915 [Ophiocordyceps australis]|uniref:Uncharacterized protein n=1 Tax=Ophiocordyceps australis TaxID=1399860 RepID=A0A2C5XIT0_9HYPO|nr:hypothetical protein CDD81_4915 [Ophiocordyceps australis]